MVLYNRKVVLNFMPLARQLERWSPVPFYVAGGDIMTAYEILMVIITIALLVVEIIKLCKSENKK